MQRDGRLRLRQRREDFLVEGRTHELTKPRVVLGRSRECDIRVSDVNVSRRHSEVRHQGDDYWIADARLGVARGPWEARVIVRNLFDVEHATFGTFNINQGAGDVLERFLSPGAPRTVQLVVQRTIGR